MLRPRNYCKLKRFYRPIVLVLFITLIVFNLSVVDSQPPNKTNTKPADKLVQLDGSANPSTDATPPKDEPKKEDPKTPDPKPVDKDEPNEGFGAVGIIFGMVLMFGLTQMYAYWVQRQSNDSTTSYRAY